MRLYYVCTNYEVHDHTGPASHLQFRFGSADDGGGGNDDDDDDYAIMSGSGVSGKW